MESVLMARQSKLPTSLSYDDGAESYESMIQRWQESTELNQNNPGTRSHSMRGHNFYCLLLPLRHVQPLANREIRK